MNNKIILGHISALITVFIWGGTFVSTKVLLENFEAIEILLFRFIIGFLALCLICSKKLGKIPIKQELLFIGAGLSGICLYYLFENIALTYTMASNVGIIICAAPFFTAILTKLFFKNEEKLNHNFFIGFLTAMIGISLISYNGARLELNPLGDILAFLAAIVWAFYSILTKKIAKIGYSTLLSTKRIFMWGILFIIPFCFIFDFKFNSSRFLNSINLFNLLFLGLGASALCFISWNFSLKVLGAIKTSVYIYLSPIITVLASIIVLKEQLTSVSFAGILLTLVGVYFSKK